MAILSFMAACPTHVAHVESYEAHCWGEATVAALSMLTAGAVIDEIPALAAEWLSHDGTDSFELAFTPEYGETVTMVYTV